MSNWATYLNQTPIFEWLCSLVWLQERIYIYRSFKKNCLCVQNMITILDSIGNIIGVGGLYEHLMSTRIFTLLIHKIFI